MSAEPAGAIISFDSASKWYGDVIGVNQITLGIAPGVTGLLGPNGAGKSTMMKLMTGQLKTGGGKVRVLGMDPWSEPALYHRLGYCPDVDRFYEDLSGREFITLMGRLTNLGGAESDRRAKAGMERVGLADAMNRPIRGYSKGMRQRTKLAAALLHDPEVLILDEPLNGLDVVGRRDFLAMFRELGRTGKTVVVSSHILHEVESMTQQIALIHHGRMLADGLVDEIRMLIENQPLTLQIMSEQPRLIGGELAALEDVSSLTYADGSTLVVRTKRPESIYERLQSGVLADRFDVSGILALDDNLEAIFSYLVKE